MTKPPFLYHGSCKGIEGPLTPREQAGDINGIFPEGSRKVVFATHDADLAAVYTLKNSHMLTAGLCEDKHFSILRDHEGWKKELATSASKVYALPSESFTQTIGKDGKPTVEWQSNVAVMPAHSVKHTPETVMKTGAQLFFLDAKVTGHDWHYAQGKAPNYSFMNRITAKMESGLLPKDFTTFNLARELIDAGIMRHLNADTGLAPVTLPRSPAGALIKEDIDWLKEHMIGESKPPEGPDKSWANSITQRVNRILAENAGRSL